VKRDFRLNLRKQKLNVKINFAAWEFQPKYTGLNFYLPVLIPSIKEINIIYKYQWRCVKILETCILYLPWKDLDNWYLGLIVIFKLEFCKKIY